MEPEDLRKVLQTLPPTLESLSLTFAGAEACFADEAPSFSSIFGDEEDYGDKAKLSNTWPLQNFFPALNSLFIRDTILESKWGRHELEALPPSLTHLSLSARLACESLYQYIPPGITSLNMERTFWWSSEMTQALPRTLTSIGQSAPTANLEAFPFLPEFLDVRGLALTSEEAKSLPLDQKTLGPINYLTIGEHERRVSDNGLKRVAYTEDWLALLPQTLTKLKLMNSTPLLRLRDLAILPKSITDLYVYELIPEEPGSMSLNVATLPNLLSITFGCHTQEAHGIVLFLPRSLTSLNFLSGSKGTKAEVEYPPLLRHLEWRSTFISSNTSTMAFPRNLTRLILDTPVLWDAQAVSGLPRAIMFLELCESLLTDKACAHLPSTLLSLVVGEVARENDPCALNGRHPSHASSHPWRVDDVPPGLEAPLEFDWPEGTDLVSERNVFAEMFGYSSDNDDQVKPEPLDPTLCFEREVSVEALPNGLKTFELTRRKHYTRTLIATLPRGLTSLKVPFISALHDRETAALPRGLKELSSSSFGALTDEDLNALPKTITRLALYITDNSKQSPDVDAFLPPNLDQSGCNILSATRVQKQRAHLSQPIQTPDPRVRKRFEQ